MYNKIIEQFFNHRTLFKHGSILIVFRYSQYTINTLWMPLSQTRGPQNIVAVITSNQSYDRTITGYGKNLRLTNYHQLWYYQEPTINDLLLNMTWEPTTDELPPTMERTYNDQLLTMVSTPWQRNITDNSKYLQPVANEFSFLIPHLLQCLCFVKTRLRSTLNEWLIDRWLASSEQLCQ